MATGPTFASTPRHAGVLCSNNGTVVTALTAVPAGTRIDRGVVIASGSTTSPFLLRLLLDDGAAALPFYEQPITGNTVSTSNAAVRYEFGFTDLVLASGEAIKAVLTSSENIVLHLHGADLT
jgi:hypothetical protein